DIEVLRCLDDADLGVNEVRHGLVQEVGAGCEVGVEDDDELTAANVQGVVQVAGLLQPAPVGPHNVPEPVAEGQVAHRLAGRVIEHVDRLDATPGYAADVVEGVVEYVQWLAAARQEHVDRRLEGHPPPAHPRLVLIQGQPGAPDAQPEVHDDRRGQNHEETGPGRGGHPRSP